MQFSNKFDKTEENVSIRTLKKMLFILSESWKLGYIRLSVNIEWILVSAVYIRRRN